MNVPSMPPRKMSLLEQVEPSTGSGLLFVTNGMNLLAFAMAVVVVLLLMWTSWKMARLARGILIA